MMPGYFQGKKETIEPEEPPSCLVPLLQIAFAWKLEILVTAVCFILIAALANQQVLKGQLWKPRIFLL